MTRTEIEAAKEEDLWCDITDFPRKDWMNEAREGDTQLGYWDWVESQLCLRNAAEALGDDITAYLEIANEALKDGNFFVHCAQALDTSDEEMVRLRDQLQLHMGLASEGRMSAVAEMSGPYSDTRASIKKIRSWVRRTKAATERLFK